MNYADLKEKQTKEVNEFLSANCFWAFSPKQFNEGLKKMGLTQEKDDLKKLVRIDGGGYLLKTKLEQYDQLAEKIENELKEAIKADKVGDGFIFQMFEYELNNYEYSYTMDVGDTLDALGLTADEVMNNEALKNGLELAHKSIMAYN